jgi:predicted AAA+ superfamily ATPase
MNTVINREIYLEQLQRLKDVHIIKVVTGLRRSGKSTLLEMLAQQIRKSGVQENRVQEYNFEKPIFSF